MSLDWWRTHVFSDLDLERERQIRLICEANWIRGMITLDLETQRWCDTRLGWQEPLGATDATGTKDLDADVRRKVGEDLPRKRTLR